MLINDLELGMELISRKPFETICPGKKYRVVQITKGENRGDILVWLSSGKLESLTDPYSDETPVYSRLKTLTNWTLNHNYFNAISENLPRLNIKPMRILKRIREWCEHKIFISSRIKKLHGLGLSMALLKCNKEKALYFVSGKGLSFGYWSDQDGFIMKNKHGKSIQFDVNIVYVLLREIGIPIELKEIGRGVFPEETELMLKV